jgi:hypothetical protein
LAYYRDSKWDFYACRNRWQDENDIVVSVLTRNVRGYIQVKGDGGLMVAAFGKKFKWGKVQGQVKAWQPATDGSAILTMADGSAVAIDFSQASGTDGLLVTTGPAEGTKFKLGDTILTLKYLTAGPEPMAEVQGDRIVVGQQTIFLKGGNLVLGKMAGPAKDKLYQS